MIYLVTGAAGFIGAKTAEMLILAGHHVVGLDNLNYYYDVGIKHYRLNHLKLVAAGSGKFTFHPFDIENASTLADVFSQYPFDAVINLAARAGVRYSMENPSVYVSTNVQGTVNLLEAMRQHQVNKLVLASTSSLYAGLPMPFIETHPVNTPISPYAATKKAAEVLAYTWHCQYGIDVSVVRYFTVFGPAGRPDMSPYRFIEWVRKGEPIHLFGDGTQSRDFTYVDDVARGTIAALQPVGYEIFNIGGGHNPVSLNTVIDWIQEDIGKEAIISYEPPHSADMEATFADISKAEHLLGWKPIVSTRDGFKMTAKWHLETQPK